MSGCKAQFALLSEPGTTDKYHSGARELRRSKMVAPENLVCALYHGSDSPVENVPSKSWTEQGFHMENLHEKFPLFSSNVQAVPTGPRQLPARMGDRSSLGGGISPATLYSLLDITKIEPAGVW